MVIEVFGKIPVAKKLLVQIGEKILATLGINKSVRIGLFLVGDKRIADKRFRKVNQPTDVLSFPLEQIRCELGNKIKCRLPKTGEEFPDLGDIFISSQTARRQAKKYKNSYKEEIVWLFIHGLLHLCGLDHKSAKEKQAWNTLEARFLRGDKQT